MTAKCNSLGQVQHMECVCVFCSEGVLHREELLEACVLKLKMLLALCRSVIRIRARLERSRKHMLMLHAVVMAS